MDKDIARDSYQTRLPIIGKAPGMQSTKVILIHSFTHLQIFSKGLLGIRPTLATGTDKGPDRKCSVYTFSFFDLEKMNPALA